MPDLTDEQRAEFVKITNENEDQVTGVTSDKELQVYQSKPIRTILESQIEEGNAFIFSAIDTLGNGQNLDFVITTPDNTDDIELFVNFKVENSAEVHLYENPTLTKGTEQNVYNRNRKSSNTANSDIHAVTAVSAVGTELFVDQIGATGGKGGSTDFNQRWILKANEEYLIRLTSGIAGNNVAIALDWFESEGV